MEIFSSFMALKYFLGIKVNLWCSWRIFREMNCERMLVLNVILFCPVVSGCCMWLSLRPKDSSLLTFSAVLSIPMSCWPLIGVCFPSHLLSNWYYVRQREKTKKVMKSLNPMWEQQFHFYVSPNTEYLLIEVFDRQSMGYAYFIKGVNWFINFDGVFFQLFGQMNFWEKLRFTFQSWRKMKLLTRWVFSVQSHWTIDWYIISVV